METTPYSKLYSKFLDDKEIACRIYEMLANDVLGKEQLEKIKLRYDDMYRNFFNYSKDEAQKLGLKDAIWEFSSGVEPFTPTGWNRYWFNLKNNDKRIMLVAQDPLRDNTWYSDIDKFPKGKTGCKEDYICIDALVASPFGLHGKSWRDKKNGGGRMALLVEKLIEHGYGVYLTDCRKYFVYDHRESAEYSKEKKNIYKAILQKEIGIVNPQRIVAVGNEAYDYCHELIGDDVRLLHVPHISGLAAKKQKIFFELGENKKTTIEELVERYAKYIISEGK